MVWTDDPFSNASFPPRSRYSIHLFLQIVLMQNSYCFNSVHQTAATTFAFSSVFILHVWFNYFRRLYLGGCSVSDTGLTGLAGACSGLRHLGLANTEVTDQGIALLGEVTSYWTVYCVLYKYFFSKSEHWRKVQSFWKSQNYCTLYSMYMYLILGARVLAFTSLRSAIEKRNKNLAWLNSVFNTTISSKPHISLYRSLLGEIVCQL